MKLSFYLILFIFLQAQSCKKEATVRVPGCIRDKIEAIQQQPKFDPPASVYRYLYGNKYVFLFSSNCCDQYNYLYDKDCNLVCAPTGGITGRGNGDCPNFSQMASDETLIWKDPR
ncbi:MAG TPA: hypothetical protein VK588_08535 [Chitinophagaceae bacterium]|nr:hypothetical protein [Chitinophagaceae bacterium]